MKPGIHNNDNIQHRDSIGQHCQLIAASNSPLAYRKELQYELLLKRFVQNQDSEPSLLLLYQAESHLASEFPKNRDINICHDVISDVAKKKPSEPISIFLVNIYANDEYRIPILESDENFFKNSKILLFN